jgi:hypothetical protein
MVTFVRDYYETSCPPITETFTILFGLGLDQGLKIVIAFVMLATP